MDEISLAILAAETKEDCRVIAEAAELARLRYEEESPSGVEAAAYQLTRSYNVLEQVATRVAQAFENHIEDRQGWHTELIRRLSLDIPGIRPPLFPPEMVSELRELRGFRHIFVHSYDLSIDKEKVGVLISRAREVATKMPSVCEDFISRVREGISQ